MGFTTDNGNVILDVSGLSIVDPGALETTINGIAGVVTVGLFARRGADVILMGGGRRADARRRAELIALRLRARTRTPDGAVECPDDEPQRPRTGARRRRRRLHARGRRGRARRGARARARATRAPRTGRCARWPTAIRRDEATAACRQRAGRRRGARPRASDAAFVDRLTLNPKAHRAMADGLREIAALPDPVGEITELRYRPSGIQVGRMRVPLGVVGIIYESRPNVTADAAALCLKSGNATILRGGSEAMRSNQAIAALRARRPARRRPARARGAGRRHDRSRRRRPPDRRRRRTWTSSCRAAARD